jgi:hypothetical protein
MAILSTDIVFRLSGGAANASLPASLGGTKSATVVPATATGHFDTVTGAESTAGDVEYRCIYLHNNSAQTLIGAYVAVQSDTPEASTTIAVGVGTSAVNATEQTVGDENTAPAGVTFGTSATLGDIPGSQGRAFWIRRTTTAGASPVGTGAGNGTQYTLRLGGDTAA